MTCLYKSVFFKIQEEDLRRSLAREAASRKCRCSQDTADQVRIKVKLL